MQLTLTNRDWNIGAPIAADASGFGSVRSASDSLGNQAVAKFVPKAPGAERELLIGEALQASGCRNVVPVLDVGETEDAFVIVMSRASTSLAQYVASKGLLPLEEALHVLRDVAEALAELAALSEPIVHRDLKPQNILLFEDRWCLADFGISRYADAATGAETRKGYFTKPYAAPEQWQLQRATSSTDMYALGVIAYELLAGRLPFRGPDFREQHLMEVPAPLTVGTSRLRSLVDECLTKAPAGRPTAANFLIRIAKAASEPHAAGAARLAQVAEGSARLRAEAEALGMRSELAEQEDDQIFAVAETRYVRIASELLSAVNENAPNATVKGRLWSSAGDALVVDLQDGQLSMSRVNRTIRFTGPFRVVAHADIRVSPRNDQAYRGRAHSLWFCDAVEAGRFAWYELSFMRHPLQPEYVPLTPFALEPTTAAECFRGMARNQLAMPLKEIDMDDPSEFVDQWLDFFAAAASRSLGFPGQLPEGDPRGSWRGQ